MLVKWLPALARQCCWTRRLETKGLLVSPPPPLPPDRFFLFNQRVKKRDRAGGGAGGHGRRAKWWGRVESQSCYRKISLGSSRCRTLATRKRSQQDACSHCHTASTTPPPPASSPRRAGGSFGFLRHREITYIISHKITQSNSYLPTSSSQPV